MYSVRQPSNFSRVMTAGLWLTILTIAFFMQVVPFLLILTMLNLAVGVTSGVALVLIPIAAFGMLLLACWFATRRTRDLLPPPMKDGQIYISPTGKPSGHMSARNVHACLLPHLKRWTWRDN